MANAVIVLGAGSSAPFGVPTLRNIFKDVKARQQLRTDSFLQQKLDEIFWSPRKYDIESSHRGLTIEEILTITRDYEKNDYGLDCLFGDELERFKRSLYVLIKKAVYDGKSSRGAYLTRIIHKRASPQSLLRITSGRMSL